MKLLRATAQQKCQDFPCRASKSDRSVLSNLPTRGDPAKVCPYLKLFSEMGCEMGWMISKLHNSSSEKVLNLCPKSADLNFKTTMDKLRKIELIQRTLGIRHKLKVHDSMKVPDNHEDLAIYLNARWELEDELRAIDEILNDARATNVAEKKKLFTGPNAKSFLKKTP